MVLISKPSREFRRHHDVDEPQVDERAFRQGWQVRTRLDQLLADDRISRGEWQAASEYRTAWAIAASDLSPSPGRSSVDHAGSSDAGLVARLVAVGRLRRVEDIIGPLANSLLVACVVHDMTWAAIGRQCGRNPETVRDWTALAIRNLAPAWAIAGRPEGPGAAPSGRRSAGRPVRAS